MDSTTISHAHSAHVSRDHHIPDRFDALRRDRMMVGSILAYVRTLARIDRLAERAEKVLSKVDAALQAMDRIALETLALEAEARSTGRTLSDDGPDFEDVADPCEWPAWTDADAWTPTDVLALSIPPISGGAPFEPSEADWDDFHSWVDALDGRLSEADVITATGCC